MRALERGVFNVSTSEHTLIANWLMKQASTVTETVRRPFLCH